MLIDLMMNGSGDGGLICIHILSAKREHIDSAIISAIYLANAMKYAAALKLQTKTFSNLYSYFWSDRGE